MCHYLVRYEEPRQLHHLVEVSPVFPNHDTLDDVKGLRMRIPGLGGKVFKRAGGNPVLLPGSEVYTALERGTIDATEWVAPFHDMRLGLNRAAKYYYFPGWHEPGTEFELMINSHAWP